MPETAVDLAMPRKPVASEGEPSQCIPLTLVITDKDSVAELLNLPEGRERDEYALAALRIGIMSLKHAHGQIDADAVRREGDRLLGELAQSLGAAREEIHDKLAMALKEYFDPESGRFQDRVNRLVKQDGELEQLMKRQVEFQSTELGKRLEAHIGDNSPLMRLLKPDEAAGLVSSMRAAMETVMQQEQERILGEFSMDNEGGALKHLVGELTDANGKLRAGLATDIEKVVQEFSLDKDDSALSRLVKRVETAEETITKEFSLDDENSALSRLSVVVREAKGAIDANLTLDAEGSALARLRKELVTLLTAHQDRVQEFQANVQSALEGMKAQRKEAARSTTHGKDFEIMACEVVERKRRKPETSHRVPGT